MFFRSNNPKELEKLAQTLNQCVTDLIKERSDLKFTKDPEVKRKNIIEYQGRMRVDGMEKFGEPTFISTVNYYASAADMQQGKTLGALVVYVEQGYIVQLLKKMKYPLANDEDENEMKDCCGTLCNIIAGRFKSAVSAMGYVELEMSHFSNYKNSAFNGVDFNYNEWDKYEISFFLEGEKRLVVEMTMGIIPKAK